MDARDADLASDRSDPDTYALAQLQRRMKACRRCLKAGYDIVPPAVFSGDSGADVMIIAQAPGITEQQTERPMNAGSGRRLFGWLQEAGWDEDEFRARHYMTAVTKCYPGRSDSGKGDRVPSTAEQALCRGFLDGELALVKPSVVIPVGGLAIKLFYPASIRLRDVIGTAAYFQPATLTGPNQFDIKHAVRLQDFDPERPRDGRWLVPLPHPSGASLWPNRPQNKKLIAVAIHILRSVREAWQL